MIDTSSEAVKRLIDAIWTHDATRADAADALGALLAERDGLKSLRDIDGRSFDLMEERAAKAEAERDAAFALLAQIGRMAAALSGSPAQGISDT